MVDAAGTTLFTSKGWGGINTEDGPWASDTVTYGYNTARERNSLTLQQPTGSWSQTYNYDGAHRMTTVTSPAGAFTYNYSTGGFPAPASREWVRLDLPNTSKILNSYDSQGRLTLTQLQNSANTVLNRHEYNYNNRHERTKHTRTDNSFVNFTYDSLGQLTNAPAFTATGTPIANEQISYAYDTGWNLPSGPSTVRSKVSRSMTATRTQALPMARPLTTSTAT